MLRRFGSRWDPSFPKAVSGKRMQKRRSDRRIQKLCSLSVVRFPEVKSVL
jgi:hypothetical protein